MDGNRMEVDVQSGIVRILKRTGKTAGAGFVVTRKGHIATCAHVVKAAGSGPTDTVELIFHATKVRATATVEGEFWREPNMEDVAILRLTDGDVLPDGVEVLPLGSSKGSDDNHPFKTFGFPAAKPVEGMGGAGIIIARATENNFPVLQLQTPEVTIGYSGAPALDTSKRRVVGMVVSVTKPDDHERLKESSFITPTETLEAYAGFEAFGHLSIPWSRHLYRETSRVLLWAQAGSGSTLGETARGTSAIGGLGPSGSGKSSVVQAGLIPQLRQGRLYGGDSWELIVNSRYDNALERRVVQSLEGAEDGLVTATQALMARNPEKERLLLVMDQFEQLLLPAYPEPQRQEFLKQLTDVLEEASDKSTALLVMRDDFYSRLAEDVPVWWEEKKWLPEGLVQIPGGLTNYLKRDKRC